MSTPDQPVTLPAASGPTTGTAKSPLAFVQPFGNDVCESWHEADAHASAPIHEEALAALRSLESQGRIVLLSAPRAGHGKTHLLGRVAARLQPASIVTALPWETRIGLNWHATANGILQDLATPYRTASHQEIKLIDICRGVLAILLMRLVQTGKVPSANPAQTLQLLQNQPKALFTREGAFKVLAEWFQAHFPTLRKTLAGVSGITETQWVEAWLQRFMFVACQNLSPNEILHVLQQGIPHHSEVQAETSAECLLRLMASWKPIVLVADHMDGLYRDPEAGLAVARMALALSTLPRVRVLLSMNQDLWDTTLGRQLPSAMQDRLSASSINLQGMDLPEAKTLILLRLREAKVSAIDISLFLQFVDLESYFASSRGTVAPRELLRYAARRWHRWLHPEPSADASSTAANIQDQNQTKVRIQPSQLKASDNDASAEDLERLRLSLEQDADGQHIDLSSFPYPLGNAQTSADVVPLPEENDIPWQGSFLVMDDGDAESTTDKDTEPNATNPVAAEVSNETEVASSRQKEVSETSTSSSEETEDITSPRESIESVSDTLDSGDSISSPPEASAPPASTPTPSGALKRLGEMMARLRKATSPTSDSPSQDSIPSAQTTPPPSTALTAENLRDQFEEARSQISALPPDPHWLRDMVHLAGENSALLKLDHIELPGLSCQHLLRWAWNGSEVLFTIASLTQSGDWRLISSYIAGRLAEFANATSQFGEPGPEYKWAVLLQNDEEVAQLQSHIDSKTIPASLETHLDRVRFSDPQISDLLALWHLSLHPTIQTDPALTQAWQNLLANRLDFFWRRLTRPLNAAAT